MPSTLRWCIIIGAGLSAAYRLSTRGWNVTVRAALHMVDRMEQMWVSREILDASRGSLGWEACLATHASRMIFPRLPQMP